LPELHTTSTAAALLGVSEASVRRWSDAGLLPVQRLGRRRARRYDEADLLKFKQRQPASAIDEPGAAITAGAVRLPVHAHLATFYDSDASRLRLTLPLLRDGLIAGETCLLVAGEDLASLYLDALRQSGIDIDAALTNKQLEILPYVGTSIKSALDAVEDFLWRTTRTPGAVPRVVGEMVSERKAFPSDSEMIDYEYAVNALTERFPCVVICQYDVRSFAGPTLLGALKAHPDVFDMPLGGVLL
jgi:hypothetical protein